MPLFKSVDSKFNGLERDGGLKARALGTFIENGIDGELPGIADAFGEIAVASDSNDQIRMVVRDQLASQRASGSHCHFDGLVGESVFNCAYIAGSAICTVVDIIGNTDLALGALQQ